MMKIKERIENVVSATQKSVPMEAIGEISHYYSHAEYEMALEGLIIELVKAEATVERKTKEEIFQLALDLGLDEEQIFDCDIWLKFKIWYRKE